MSTMSNEPREKLKDILGKNGESILQDPDRCEGLLKDHCGPFRREISAIVGALEERIPVDLKSSWQTAMTPEAMRARLVQRLQDHRGLAPEVADWAVDTWSYALGVGLGRKSDRLNSVVMTGAAAAAPAMVAGAGEEFAGEFAASQPKAQQATPAVVPAAAAGAAGWTSQKKSGAGLLALAAVAVAGYMYLHPATNTVVVVPCDPAKTQAGDGNGCAPDPKPEPKKQTDLKPEPAASNVLKAGTALPVTVHEAISSDHVAVGQYVKGTIDKPVSVDGKALVPAGTPVVLQVRSVDQTAESGTATINLALVQMTIGSKKYDVPATRYTVKGPGKVANATKKGGIGAAIGCGVGTAIGSIFHKKLKGCVEGAAAGGGVGVVTSLDDQLKPAELKAGTVVRFSLSQPLSIG